MQGTAVVHKAVEALLARKKEGLGQGRIFILTVSFPKRLGQVYDNL